VIQSLKISQHLSQNQQPQHHLSNQQLSNQHHSNQQRLSNTTPAAQQSEAPKPTPQALLTQRNNITKNLLFGVGTKPVIDLLLT
jgi:hypothetical protein